MIRELKSKVMAIANRLVGSGWTRSIAMRRAWILAKSQKLSSRVVGTSFDNRQELLRANIGKQAAAILKHETNNRFDENAVSVWLSCNKGQMYFRIGYLPKAVASVMAPLLDSGKSKRISRCTIVGGYSEGMNCGARISLCI